MTSEAELRKELKGELRDLTVAVGHPHAADKEPRQCRRSLNWPVSVMSAGPVGDLVYAVTRSSVTSHPAWTWRTIPACW